MCVCVCVCACAYTLVPMRNSPSPQSPAVSSIHTPKSLMGNTCSLLWEGHFRGGEEDKIFGGKGRQVEGIRDEVKPVAVAEFL